MRIDSLKLENVRALEHFEGAFPAQFTVIVGKNGRGKTTILDMIARILSRWTPTPKALLQRRDTRDEIRNGGGAPHKKVFQGMVWVEGQGPDGSPFAGSHALSYGRAEYLSKELSSRRDAWARQIDADDTLPLPLLVLFSPFRDPPQAHRPKPGAHRPQTRESGYDGAFDLWADVRQVTNWFHTFGQASIQEERTFPWIEAAREAVIGCLPGCVDLRYLRQYDEVMVKWKDGNHEPVWRLSDGYRTMVALVGEMALRAVTLNPVGEAGRPQNIEGVVLIDEIDIHLHPQWQRQVVGALRRTLPKVQFIATTHSPFIVQSMEPDEVINLDRAPSLDYQQSSIEDIAEVEMGLDHVQRSRVFQEKVLAAQEYLQLLSDRCADPTELARRKARLDELQARFGNDPVYVASLLQKRAARGLE